MIGKREPARISPATIHQMLMPPRKITNMPAEDTRMAVPRSGCLAMSTVGMAMIMSAVTTFMKRGGRLCFPIRAATVIGMTIFRNSEGWIRMKPILSQRCAPLLISPKNITARSMARQIPNKSQLRRSNTRGFIWAIRIISIKLRPVRTSCLRSIS